MKVRMLWQSYIYARSTNDDTITDDTLNVKDLAYCLLMYGSS